MMDHRKFYLSASKHHPYEIDPLVKQICNKERYGKQLLRRISRQSSRSRVNLISNHRIKNETSFVSAGDEDSF